MTTNNKRDANRDAQSPSTAEIAAEAYAIFRREGSVHGRDVEHWLRAEAALRERRAGAVSPPSREQEQTDGKEGVEQGRQGSTVGSEGAGQGPQAAAVERREEPRQGESEASRAALPEPGGQHAGSGQVQRRDDAQAVQQDVRRVGPRDQEQPPPPEQSPPDPVSANNNEARPKAGTKRKAPGQPRKRK